MRGRTDSPPKKPELLLPAGALDRLKTAFLYGADAVYCGFPSFSMRRPGKESETFTPETLEEGIAHAHALGKRVYVAVNIFPHEEDLPALPDIAAALNRLRPDGLIAADAGVVSFLRREVPGIPLHVSTQANVCSSLAAQAWQAQGAARVVLARELSIPEIAAVRKACPGLELEVFIHGALCIGVSGRCLISHALTGRSANKGACAHSCRWNYKVYLEEEKRPGELFPMEEDGRGAYLMNSKDLCAMPVLDRLLELGLSSLKIEGRNKSVYYTAATARAYRAAIDAWAESPESWSPAPFMAELNATKSRGFTTGFLEGAPSAEAENRDGEAFPGDAVCAGFVREAGADGLVLEVFHKLVPGTRLEFLPPGRFSPAVAKLSAITDADTRAPLPEVSAGRAKQAVFIPWEDFAEPAAAPALLPPLSVARLRREAA